MNQITTRPRGFIQNWRPIGRTEELIGQVQAILLANDDILPLTLRQIFYMLVSGYKYDKTEKSYKRLCEIMNRARRAQVIPMQSIRDDGLREKIPHGWHDKKEFIQAINDGAAQFRINRQKGQPQHIMVWCEAGGMVPQLARYCRDYGVPVLSSGGFDSLTTKHDFAQSVGDYDRVEVLHVGDHDPSGVHMCSSLDEDVAAFVEYYGGDFDVTRLAVTPVQIEAMKLPTAPPKKTDRRSFTGMTTQAEAIPPKILREIVTDEIKARMDEKIYKALLKTERNRRAELVKAVTKVK